MERRFVVVTLHRQPCARRSTPPAPAQPRNRSRAVRDISLVGLVGVVLALVHPVTALAGPSATDTTYPPPLQFNLTDGAAVIFDSLSADGCVHTTGQLGTFWALSYPDPTWSGAIAFGIQENTCEGTQQVLYGTSHEEVFVLGLVCARIDSMLLAGDGMHWPPVTFEFDLSWLGTGAVTHACTSTSDAGVLDVSCFSARAAVVGGNVTIDGDQAVLSTPMMAQETFVEIRWGAARGLQ